MLRTSAPISQRLVRKGALVEETYTLFRNWKQEMTFDQNFNHSLHGSFRSEAWKKEVHVTLRRRFRDLKAAKPLILLARGGYDISDWKFCLHFWIAMRETLYSLFLTTWLYPEYQSGRLSLRTEDAVHHVLAVWKSSNPAGAPLSEYGATRTARDLLRMARDLGLLEGEGPAKTFSSVHLSGELFVYFCHIIASEENSTSRVLSSELWKLLLLNQDQVHAHLLRLHQYRKLEYHVAGSIVELTLPCANACQYTERMVA
ncbi:MAG: BrxA family protein [Terracidiphilus sp.]|jgi:hypothetical protein